VARGSGTLSCVRLAAALLCCAALPPAGAASAAAAPDALQESLLQVQLNGVDTGNAVLLLRGADGRLAVCARDLRRWRLRTPAGAPLQPAPQHDGEAFYRVDDIAGLRYTVDEARQVLALQADAGLFDTTALNLEPAGFQRPATSPPGAFLNYDLSSSRADRRWQNGSLLEVGGFNALGGGVGSFVLRDGIAAGPHAVRLETTWTHDLPGQRASLRLGDAVSRAGQWGRAVRFGGVQWATNFSTQPGLVTFPLPSLAGEAVLPSTVDLYVNDALQLRREVPAGPFDLRQLPVVSGQGEARLVVRDLLGREQTIVAPYYATPRLLRAGLHDFSYEAGRIRQDFGLASNRYGRAALVATHRLGLSDRATVEAHGEWVESQRTGGVGAALWWPGVGTFNASAAASRRDDVYPAYPAYSRNGGLVALGAERQGYGYSVGVNRQATSRGFTQIGQQPDQPAVRRNLQAYASMALGRGSLAVSYLVQTPRDRDPVSLVSLGYSMSLGSYGFIGVSLLRSGGPQGRTTAYLTFSRSLDNRTTLSGGATLQPGGPQEQVQVQRNLPPGDGTGYRLRALNDDRDRDRGTGQRRIDAAGIVQHAAGTAGLEASIGRDDTALRATATGGLVWLDGGLYPSRRVESSFAVVQVPGQANVGVYADNQLVARTAADGSALVPRLRPYQANPVRIEQADLPLDAQVDQLQLDAVPAYRSGIVLRFPVRQARGFTLRALQADGRPVPAGAVARVAGQGAAFPLGLGHLYVEGSLSAARIVFRWTEGAAQQGCTVQLTAADAERAGADAIPDLGEQPCR